MVNKECIGPFTSAEHVVGFVWIREFTTEAQHGLVRSMFHQGCIDRRQKSGVAVVKPVWIRHAVELVAPAVGAGNEAVE